jgi:hypothetical protein
VGPQSLVEESEALGVAVSARDCIVFLGPSLALREARAILAADYRAPARQGDIFRAICEQPRCIVLLDGVFDWAPSVWHHELIAALSSGIAVYGASSMGALRAAELHALGMRGVGQIFRRYRDGELIDDDAVALLHGPKSMQFRPLTVPWVNAEATIEAAARARVFPRAVALALSQRAQALGFRERTWRKIEAVLSELASTKVSAFSQFREIHSVDLKAKDARACLRAVKRSASRGKIQSARPGAAFSALVRERRWNETHAEVLKRLRSAPKQRRLRDIGARVLALSHWAKTLKLEASAAELRAALEILPKNGLAPDVRMQFAETLALEALVLRSLSWIVSDAPTESESLALGAMLTGQWKR